MAVAAPVDPKTIPALSGVFAPVHEEHDAPSLAVQAKFHPICAGRTCATGRTRSTRRSAATRFR